MTDNEELNEINDVIEEWRAGRRSADSAIRLVGHVLGIEPQVVLDIKKPVEGPQRPVGGRVLT